MDGSGVVTLLLIAALVFSAVLIFAGLLTQLGCRLIGAEVPSFGMALFVNFLYMIAGFLANLTILFGVAYAVGIWGAGLSEAEARLTVMWGSRALQFVVDGIVFASIASLCFNRVSFAQGLVIGIVQSIGLVALGFLAAMTVSGLIAFQR